MQEWFAVPSTLVGDPTVVGWVTLVAYLVTASLCLRASRAPERAPGTPGVLCVYVASVRSLLRVPGRGGADPGLASTMAGARLAALWLGLAVAMFALGLNKQLDLHVAIGGIGRRVARAQGWYEERRAVQIVFVVLVGLAGVFAVGVILQLAKGQLRGLWPALVGAGWLVAFVFVRAASFHHVDAFFRADRPARQFAWVLEVLGIASIAWCAVRTRPRGEDARAIRSRSGAP